MKSILLALLVMLSSSSCLTPQVRDKTLLPAIQTAWVGVRADAEYAAADGPISSDLEAWDAAVEAGDFAALDVLLLVADARAGVQYKLEDGVIGPQGAAIMMDRAVNFGKAVTEYMRENLLVSYEKPRKRRYREGASGPLVISRSSWATSPPSAIAGEVYR